ncbi:arginine--tRNA ligase [Mycoplasmopsis cricetuli]|uniref:arginine--tRNA ligase n=1 Tax=Mycoplasmopsis cricetuli TaxID=171283 RepID=UPI00068469DD|nr:arginine--tRNA ligase [Mycoplasmopsis cricetuli]
MTVTLNKIIKEELEKIFVLLQKENLVDLKIQFKNLNFNITEPAQNNEMLKKYEYATNFAFILKKYSSRSILELAQFIVDKLNKVQLNSQKLFKDIHIAMPGFINMSFNDVAFKFVLQNVLQTAHGYGAKQTNHLDNIKPINVEYVSANPTGFLHVGHARGAAIGDSLVRIMRYFGHKVTAEYYINDAGNQIDVLVVSTRVRYNELFNIQMPMPEDCYRGHDIIWLAKKIKNQYQDKFLNNFDENYWEFRSICVNMLLEKIKSDLKNLDIEFDLFSSELAIYKSGQIDKAIERLHEHIYKKDGAIFLKTTTFGDDKDRVLVKSDGNLTYFTPDIAYHLQKLSQSSKLINIWGADHSGYIARMSIALQALGFSEDIMYVLVVQLVRLIKDGSEFKMSKRAGTSVTLDDLLSVSSKDAIRFMMVTRDSNTKFDFDIDQSNSNSQNNPVFSVQYAHSRACSILAKAQNLNLNYNFSFSEYPKIRKLILQLDLFPELVKTITQTYKVQLMTSYLIILANLYNSFYSEHKIIGSEHESSLLTLTKATQTVLQIGLNLIGVSAPEKM